MQTEEFNKLMKGEPAKWLESSELPNLDMVKKLEKPIPIEKATEMEIFIARHRANGMSEKNIRKAVKRKFRIRTIK